jgi:hypothetical protein
MNMLMNIKNSLLARALAVSLFAGLPFASANHHEAEKKAPAAKEAYPLKTCVVSDEALGSMGEAIVYVHKEAGKPDRTVKFCCEGCIDDFKKEPAKYLKKLDDAAAAGEAAKKKAGI